MYNNQHYHLYDLATCSHMQICLSYYKSIKIILHIYNVSEMCIHFLNMNDDAELYHLLTNI